MNENRDALLCLFQYIKSYIKQIVNHLSYNRTLFGTVTEVSSDGCTVNIAGQNHKIIYSNVTVSVHMQVRVTLPRNSWAQAYIESVVTDT